MSVIIDGTSGVTTPGVVNTAGETIATTLVVSGTTTLTGVTTLTGGLNAALPVLSGGTGVTTKTGTGAVVLGTSPTLATPTFDSAQLSTILGTAPLAFCRAWVSFTGTTGATRGSFNVSSITRNGTGIYTVNFTTAMTDINYSALAITAPISPNAGAGIVALMYSNGFNSVTAPLVGSFIFSTFGTASGTPADSLYLNVSVFR